MISDAKIEREMLNNPGLGRVQAYHRVKAREAIIEHERMMRRHRIWAAENRERIDAEWDSLPETVMTIDDHARLARKEMGEARWTELNKEWK